MERCKETENFKEVIYGKQILKSFVQELAEMSDSKCHLGLKRKEKACFICQPKYRPKRVRDTEHLLLVIASNLVRTICLYIIGDKFYLYM